MFKYCRSRVAYVFARNTLRSKQDSRKEETAGDRPSNVKQHSSNTVFKYFSLKDSSAGENCFDDCPIRTLKDTNELTLHPGTDFTYNKEI